MKKLLIAFCFLLYAFSSRAQLVKPDAPPISPNGPNTKPFYDLKVRGGFFFPHYSLTTPPPVQDTVGKTVLNTDDNHLHIKGTDMVDHKIPWATDVLTGGGGGAGDTILFYKNFKVNGDTVMISTDSVPIANTAILAQRPDGYFTRLNSIYDPVHNKLTWQGILNNFNAGIQANLSTDTGTYFVKMDSVGNFVKDTTQFQPLITFSNGLAPIGGNPYNIGIGGTTPGFGVGIQSVAQFQIYPGASFQLYDWFGDQSRFYFNIDNAGNGTADLSSGNGNYQARIGMNQTTNNLGDLVLIGGAPGSNSTNWNPSSSTQLKLSTTGITFTDGRTSVGPRNITSYATNGKKYNTWLAEWGAVKSRIDSAIAAAAPSYITAIKTINSTTLNGSGNINLQTPLTAGTDYLVPSGNGSGLTGFTSAQITTALGFTPYNATNPSGYTTSSNFVSGETPSGAINGINTSYTTANPPVSGTVRVFRNGLRQVAGTGAGTDYTISGSNITYNYAPSTGDSILIDYSK